MNPMEKTTVTSELPKVSASRCIIVGEILEIKTRLVRPFPNQPRKYFNKQEMLGLMDSIAEIGQQTPIVVMELNPPEDNYEFELIDGERRLRACTLLKKETILAIIKKVDSEESQFMYAIAANFCRVGHTHLEIAAALEKIIGSSTAKGLNQAGAIKKMARVVGKSEGWVRLYLSLLRLNETVKQHLLNKKISLQTAVALANQKDEYQTKFSNYIVENSLNHFQALAYIRNQASGETRGEHGRERHPFDDFEIFENFLKKVIIGTEMILDMKKTKVEKIFKTTPGKKANNYLFMLRDAIKNLQDAERTISSILKA